MKNKQRKSAGTIFGETLKELCYFFTILFCALRACGTISWPWYWIMSPIFASWIIAFVFLAIAGCICVALDEKE